MTDLLTLTKQWLAAGSSTSINAIAIESTGTIIAGGGFLPHHIFLWEVATGKPHATLTGHTGAVATVAFSPDGRLLASGSVDRRIMLWEVATGKPHATLTGHTGAVATVAFSSDGQLLASGSVDECAKLWNVTIGNEIVTVSHYIDRVSAVAFHPSGRAWATGIFRSDYPITLWSTTKEPVYQQVAGISDEVHAITFSHNGQTLACGAGGRYGGTVEVWQVEE